MPLPKRFGGRGARHHRRAAIARERGEPAGMVIMRLGAENELHVAQLEPQRANISLDRRHGLRERRVDQD
ncbi:hypothetical protein D9M73_135570 [compost metagenome]